MGRKALDLTNKRFGKLVALYSKRENNRTYWLCKCDCGNTKWIEISHLAKNKTQSCGCICTDIIQKARIDFEAKNMVEGTSLKGMTRNLNKNSSTGIKGVCFSPAVNKYVAYITFKGKKMTKRFNNIDDAIKWRKEQENIYYKPILDKYKRRCKNMEEKTSKSPKNLLTEQETAELENMTEGQLADYLAENTEY